MSKTMKTFVLMFAAAVASGAGMSAKAQNADFKGFPDVPKNHWAYQAVTNLARRGILQGYPAEGGKLKVKTTTLPNTAANAKPVAKRGAKGRQPGI